MLSQEAKDLLIAARLSGCVAYHHQDDILEFYNGDGGAIGRVCCFGGFVEAQEMLDKICFCANIFSIKEYEDSKLVIYSTFALEGLPVDEVIFDHSEKMTTWLANFAITNIKNN